MSEAERSTRPDGWVFLLFLLLLVWAPLPLASNRAWAWSLLEIGIFALSALWLLLFAIGKARFSGVFRSAWWAVSLFAAWLGALAFQVLPLPMSWLVQVSPVSARLAELVMGSGISAATISVDAEASRAFALKSLAYFLAFCLTLLLVNRRDRLRMLAFVLVGSGVVQAIYASFMHLAGFDFRLFYATYSHRSYTVGTFVNRNHLAGYLEMTLAIGIGAMIGTLRSGGGVRNWRQRFRDWLAWAVSPRIILRLMLVVMVIALVMTRSRMGNTAFFVSMLVAGMIGLALSRHATRSTVILLVSLVVIDIFIVGAWFGVEKVVTRIGQTPLLRTDKGGEQSVEERVEPGLNSLAILREYPLFGSGGGTFYTAFSKHRPGEIVAFYDFTHNDYFQFLSEVGVIGAGILGLLAASTLFVALKAQYQRSDPLSRGVAFGVTMAIIALAIHSSVDFNLQIPANALTFTVLLAMGWVAHAVERADTHSR